MPGMMQSIRSGRGVSCPCCDEWTPTRASEKRQWRREVEEELWDRTEDAEHEWRELMGRRAEVDYEARAIAHDYCPACYPRR